MKRSLTVFLPLLLSLIPLFLLSSCDGDPSGIVPCDIQALVDAIHDANANPDVTTIELTPNCTYIVDQIYADPHPVQGNITTGLPLITTDINIIGNGAVITGPYGTGMRYRIFFIEDGVHSTFSDFTLQNGLLYVGTTSDVYQGYGGAILNLGQLTIENMIFHNNRSRNGGAIANYQNGSLTVNNSEFWGNDGYFEAGAINNDGAGGAYISESVFYENTSEVPVNMSLGGMGAAISSLTDMEVINSTFENHDIRGTSGVIATFGSAEVTIRGCTFSGNHTLFHGTVLMNSGNISVINSTFSDNTSTSGNLKILFNSSGSVSISNTTIANNNSESPVIMSDNSNITITNSIIANNSGGDCDPSIALTVQGNNLDSDGSCQGFTIHADPLLDPLADNGGGTLTRALDPASPAIDKASGACPATDQRGMARPQSFFCDLGAYETEEVEACSINYLVNAIHFANSDSDPTTIELDPGCTYIVDQQYGDRQSGLPILTTPITILGNGAIITRPGLEEQPDEYRLFYVESRVPVSISDLTLSSGVITGAEGVNDNSDSHGGAIFNRGELSLAGVTIQDNQALNGGALANDARGSLTIENSAFVSNQASSDGGALYLGGSRGAVINGVLFEGNQAAGNVSGGYGGAIFNQFDLELSGSSLSANDSSQGGGGVYNLGEADLVACTMSLNSASEAGGSALQNHSGNLSLFNSTLSGNQAGPGNLYSIFNEGGLIRISYSTVTAAEGGVAALGGQGSWDNYRYDVINSIIASNPPGDCDPTAHISVYGNNLDSDGSCQGFTHTGDPLLLPFADNGGGTWTHALSVNSPALNAASAECPITDQRGVSRPQGSSCDLGAYEYDGIQPTPTPTPELDPCLYEALVNANCRVSDYPESGFITTLAQGGTALLIGINPEDTHGLFDISDYDPCWILLSLMLGVDAEACDPPCIDPPPRPTPSLVCSADLGKEECFKAGGTYIEVGVPHPFCQCP